MTDLHQAVLDDRDRLLDQIRQRDIKIAGLERAISLRDQFIAIEEEQRAALKRVAAYMDRMYGIASPYYGRTEDANILRAMIDSSEHVTEPTKMIGFDLEAARAGIAHYRIENPSNVDTESALKELVDQANLAEDALAEIERLRAELDNYGDDFVCQTKCKDARIKELEAQCEDLMQNCNSLRERAWKAEVRIKEQDDALVEERTGAIRCESYDHCEGMYRIDLPDAMIRAQQELQAEGKIGPDAAKPQSWQITEERIGLLEYCLETLLDAPDIEEIPGPGHSIEMLRAMLKEAE